MNQNIMSPSEAVGKEIKVWMTRLGVTQKDLASALGITQASVSDKLRGKTNFSFSDLVLVSSALQLSLGELLGDGLLNAKIPTTAELSNDGEKKIAPIGFIPNGATYLVAGAGFEPAASGL